LRFGLRQRYQPLGFELSQQQRMRAPRRPAATWRRSSAA
jgi:hypothetical protein